MNMTLDILIPTYNRAPYLLKNLGHLRNIISRLTNEKITIVINDNASTDDTQIVVRNFINSNPDISISYTRHSENRGFCNNVLDIITKGSGAYIMLLGDDDFPSYEYVKDSIESLKEDRDLTCILPSYEGIDEDGKRLGWGRDLGLSSTVYPSGIKSAKINSVRAHQISGIILKREGLKDAVEKARISNLYPQIFLTAFSCLKGKCKHIPEYPILVTQTSKKAWRYDDIGLLGDIFENFNALKLSFYDQFSLEKGIIKQQRWRAFRYYYNPAKQVSVISKITFNKNTSILGKLCLGPYLVYLWGRWTIGKILAKIKK